MANASEIQNKLAAGQVAKPASALSVGDLMKAASIKTRFEEMLGKKAAGFMSSVISLVNADKNLALADPRTVVAAAAMAATLDLPVNKNLGFAWIIPYSGKAEFQMGYKGFIQLAIRTGLYKTMNTSEVYADEIKSWNPITGELVFNPQEMWKMRDAGDENNIVGFMSFFRLTNGFEKFLYMTKAQMLAHARKYSKSFNNSNSKWKTDWLPMALKTTIKLLLSKYGAMSVDIQRAIQADQGVIRDAGDKDSAPQVDFIDVVANEEAEPAAPQTEETPRTPEPAAAAPAPAKPA